MWFDTEEYNADPTQLYRKFPNPNVTWAGLLPKSNRFFLGPYATFAPNSVKIGNVVYAYNNPANKQTNVVKT